MNRWEIDEQTAIRNFDDDQRKVRSRRRRQTDPEAQERKAAWLSFITEQGANLAVTLTWNPGCPGGTASSAYRITPDGECLPLRASGLIGGRRANVLPASRHVPLEQVHGRLDLLHRDLDRAVFGTRFNKLPAERRSRYVGFAEKVSEHIHVHLAWAVPPAAVDRTTEKLADLWPQIQKGGSVRIKLIRDGGWSEYVSKDQWGAALDDNAALFVASRPARSP